MRISIYIIISCILASIIGQLEIFENSFYYEGNLYTSYSGILSKIIYFIPLCLIMVLIASILTYIKYQQKFVSEFSIPRIDYNLKKHYTVVAIWLVLFIPIFYFLDLRFRVDILLIIVLSFLLYFQITKWIIQKNKPAFLYLNANKLFIKNVIKNAERNINELTLIEYNIPRNCIEFRFMDGLNTVDLFLTDFEYNDIMMLMNEIKSRKTEALTFGDNFYTILNSKNYKTK